MAPSDIAITASATNISIKVKPSGKIFPRISGVLQVTNRYRVFAVYSRIDDVTCFYAGNSESY